MLTYIKATKGSWIAQAVCGLFLLCKGESHVDKRVFEESDGKRHQKKSRGK